MAQGRNYTTLGYCDITDVSNFLMITIDPTFETQITDWIAAAETEVNNYTGFTNASGILTEQIVGETRTGRVDGQGNPIVFPTKIPIKSIQSLSVNKGTISVDLALTNSLGQTKYTIPHTADYILYPPYELAMTGSSILGSFYSIKNRTFFTKLSYIGGYDQVPADVRMATVNLVADLLMRQANKEGLEQVTQGRVTKRWANRYGATTGTSAGAAGESDFVLDAHKLLDDYKIASEWF